jgi:RNA polymerase sigma-70 factor (ECF subfamily)
VDGAEASDELIGPESLGQLLDRHGPALALFARQWCQTPDDVVQEAFLQLARQRVWPRSVVPWLYRVVRNGALSAARAEQRRRRHEEAAGAARPAWFEASDATAGEAEVAAAALAELPLEQREIIVAHLWGRLTFQQIAELVGTTSSTAHRRYEAGLEQLRIRMQPAGPAEGKQPGLRNDR